MSDNIIVDITVTIQGETYSAAISVDKEDSVDFNQIVLGLYAAQIGRDKC